MNPAQQKLVKEAILEQCGELVADNFHKALKVKGDDNQINFGLSVQVEVAENGAHTVGVKMSFSEKHTFSLEKDVDDPNQPKLPGEVGDAAAPKTRKKTSKKT
jgi:hypothetical protein